MPTVRQQYFIVLALALGISGAAAGGTQTAARPNIVFIIADDLGYNELGCYGQKWIRTPNIDRLASEGMRFTQHYTGQAVCAPARCVLMTGKHTGHAYIRDNGNPADWKEHRQQHGWEFPGQHPIPESEVTVAELLQEQGYATAAIGKWGLGHSGNSGDPNAQGFDLFYGYHCQVHAHNHYPKFLWRNDEKEPLAGNDRTLHGATYAQDRFIDVALEFIRDNATKPFFLYLPFAVPHLSIQAPPESVAEYTDVIPEEDYKHRGYLQHPTPRAGYAAMITHMDRGIGSILDLLDELELTQKTLVIFVSDNGPTYDRLGGSDSEFFESAGPFRGFKGSLYEGGIRVPMVARWPNKIAPGSNSDHISAFWDWLPTLCDVAGAEIPEQVDGVSFLPTLTGSGEQEQHEYLYWEFPSYGHQQAVRWGSWKGVRQQMSKGNLALELYNLSKDMGEQKNVAVDHPEVVAKIEQIMQQARVPSALFPLQGVDTEN